MRYYINPNMQNGTFSAHGGLSAGESGFIDFSVSLNPYPVPLPVLQACQHYPLSEYSDDRDLADALTAVLGLPPGCVLPVNGASEAIYLAAQALTAPGLPVLIPSPCFSDYARASLLHGGVVHSLKTEPPCFDLKPGKIIDTLRKSKPSALWIGRPQNPTGVLWDLETIHTVRKVCCETGTVFVVDEAFINLSSAEPLPAPEENLVVIRSMTKDFGIPGLRLGYIIAPEEVIGILKKGRIPWSVNSAAISAGLSCMENLPVFRAQWKELAGETAWLKEQLSLLQFNPLGGSANFLCVSAPAAAAALDLPRKLVGNRIKIRDCANMGAPGFFRIGTRTREENQTLVTCLRNML